MILPESLETFRGEANDRVLEYVRKLAEEPQHEHFMSRICYIRHYDYVDMAVESRARAFGRNRIPLVRNHCPRRYQHRS